MDKAISRFSWKEIGYAILLVIILQGNLFIKVIALSCLLFFNTDKILLQKSRQGVFFYLYVLGVILISFLTIGWLRNVNYFFSLLFSLIIWGFALFLFSYNDNYIKKNSKESIEKSLNILFWANVIVSISQLIFLMYEQKTINPYSGIHKTSTGDFIYGIFSNSSVNMIMSGFFFFYYYSNRKLIKSIFAALIAILTTYMGGLLLAIISFIVVLLLNPAISFKYKISGLVLIIAAYFYLNILSPENMQYAKNNIRIILSQSPPRKLVSFKETYNYSTNSISNFLFGAGPGNFSSRTAFVMGGEYVSWLPGSIIYLSPEFSQNHFQLWNRKILSLPFNDGTANQPFSHYNQLIGEYGLIGTFIFFIFYLGYFIKNYFKLTFGKYLLVFILLVFLMDYWFEYLSVIVLFEILMFLELKKMNTHKLHSN